MAVLKWTTAIVLAVAVATVSVSAYAQGRGKGNGGGPGEETGNNLSVPAILIGGAPGALSYETLLPVFPSGEPLSGYPINTQNFYYVQGVHLWQAATIALDPMATDPEYIPIDVSAEWGDNLTGSASLTTKSPIRVEIGLFANPSDYLETYNLTGWNVEKLEPDKLDREAAYGTLATWNDDVGVFESIPVNPYPELRVYDHVTFWKIYREDTPEAPIVAEPAKAEVNSTGRIVYGYNLRVETAGTYVIEFTTTNVNIEESDWGEIVDEGATVQLRITVEQNKGRRGGGPPRR